MNAMIENRRINLRQGYNIGEAIWRQLSADVISEILYDDTVMGDKVLDPRLILKINRVLEERSDYYKGAIGVDGDEEADIKRSKLDANMRGLVDDYNAMRAEDEEELPYLTFEERMPVQEITYDKPIHVNDRHPATKKTRKHRKR